MEINKSYERLINEYLGKVKVCDECFAEIYCIENEIKESRVPCKDKSKCIEAIKGCLREEYRR